MSLLSRTFSWFIYPHKTVTKQPKSPQPEFILKWTLNVECFFFVFFFLAMKITLCLTLEGKNRTEMFTPTGKE